MAAVDLLADTDRPVLSATAQRVVAAMGGCADIIAVTRDAAEARDVLDLAVARLQDLETRWSRFLDGGEIGRIDRAGGGPVAVSADTCRLVEGSIRAWRATGGRFDPTVTDRPVVHGDDPPSGWTGPLGAPQRPTGGRAGVAPAGRIVVDGRAGTVAVPAGVRIDPGGIGRGLAADLVTAAMIDAGALGAFAEVGGVVRARGFGPGADPRGWTVAVRHPTLPGATLATVALGPRGGAVASTSVLVRRWAGDRHQLIDLRSRRSAGSGVVAATVVASDGAWADALSTVALAGRGVDRAIEEIDLLDALGAPAVLVLPDDTVVTTVAALRRVAGARLVTLS